MKFMKDVRFTTFNSQRINGSVRKLVPSLDLLMFVMYGPY